MAYGPTRTSYRKRGMSASRGRRVSTYKKGRSSYRSKAVSKARTATVAARKRTIASNSRAIKKLRAQAYGAVQRNIDYTGDFTFHRDQPLLFQLTNFDSGAQKGPRVMSLANGHLTSRGNFTAYDHGGSRDYMEDSSNGHIMNGPKAKLLSSLIDLKFHGFVKDTRIRVDIVRCKKIVSDFWSDAQTHNFLPHTLSGLTRICGHTPNEIDRKSFEVIQTKYGYLNSQESISFSDAATGEEETTQPTTSPFKRMVFKVNYKGKVLKQLDETQSETYVADVDNPNASDAQFTPANGGYHYTNQHPLATWWMLISTDNANSLEGIVDSQHQPNVSIIRKNVWRDAVG